MEEVFILQLANRAKQDLSILDKLPEEIKLQVVAKMEELINE